MREYRGNHSRGSHDDIGQGAGVRDLAKERTPEYTATAEAYRLRQEVESAAARARGLAAIAQRDDWRAERDHLQQMHIELREQLEQHAGAARVSDRAQHHHATAARELDKLEAALASVREPRAIPPVHGEEAMEPRIVHRSIPADDVLAWMAELPSDQRHALVERVRRVQGSADRRDGFSVALANYLAVTRLTSQFFGVAENPRRFNRAAYDKARARANAASAAAASAADDASLRADATPANEHPAFAAAGLETSDSVASAPPFPPGSASGQVSSELPYRSEMEQSFGRPLGHVESYTGMDRELARYGAQALAIGNVVAFADARPSPALVAHEVTHAIQNEQAGAAVPMASGIAAPRENPAEAEADAVAGVVAAHGPGVRLPPITAAPAGHVQLAPRRLVPDPDLKPHPTILVPDANHPARSDVDGEQVIQTGATTAPGKTTSLPGKSWRSLAEVAESIDVRDDNGDTLHIDLTYRLESRPAEVGEVPDVWIHTERKALLTIGTGEHAGATIVGQARIHVAPGEPRDPKAAIGKPSIGPDHWAQIYLAEAGQYVNMHGPGGCVSLRADAADHDVLAYDDPLRTLVGLKSLLKQQHIAGHGGEVAKAHAQAQRLLANAKLGRAILEREIAGIKSHHDPHPGRVAPVRFLVSDIALWLAANQQAGRDQTEDARQLHKARAELEQLIAGAENAHPPRRNQFDDALHAPVRFAERTAEGVGEVGAMAVDAVVLGVDAIGEATGIGRFDYHPISSYGKSIEATCSNTTTALVTMVNGFADEWSDGIERARHGDYRGVTDVSIDTLLLIDGARTGGVIALDKADAVAAKVSNVVRSARAVLQSTYASAHAVPAEVRNIAAAMVDGADAFVARLRAGGMQMAAAGDGSGPGPQLGGLSGETLAEAAQAAKEAFKEKRLAQQAPEPGEKPAVTADTDKLSPQPASTRSQFAVRIKDRISAAGGGFALHYTDAELDAIIARGAELGLPERMVEDLVYVGSRTKKTISAADLMAQMKNWSADVQQRGFPYRFHDLAQFREFSKELLARVQQANLPIDDVRVQGSSLRSPAANDVDIAVFVDETIFDKLLAERFDGRITRGGTKLSLAGKSHLELVQLAADIEASPGSYNAQGSTFQNAVRTGIINSKSDIVKPLKQVRAELAAKHPDLNLETISILLRGGQFELLPDLPVKSN